MFHHPFRDAFVVGSAEPVLFQVTERQQRLLGLVGLVQQQLRAQRRLGRHVRRPGQPRVVGQLPLTSAESPPQGARAAPRPTAARQGQTPG